MDNIGKLGSNLADKVKGGNTGGSAGGGGGGGGQTDYLDKGTTIDIRHATLNQHFS